MSFNTKSAHRGHAASKLREMIKEYPTMSIVEIMYSIINPLVVKEGKFSSILEIDDSEMYKMICNAIEKESPDGE